MLTIDGIRKEEKVPVLIADRTGEIVFINAAFETVFGWPRAKLIGQHLNTLIPKSLRDAHNMGFSRHVTTGQATLLDQDLTLKLTTGQGKDIDAVHHIFFEKSADQEYYGATIRPL